MTSKVQYLNPEGCVRGVSAYYQTLAIGIVIILAVVLDRVRIKD